MDKQKEQKSRFAPVLRVFFKLLYHQFAWTYDAVAFLVSLGRWKPWVLSVLSYIDSPRILELGFGPGHLQEALLERGVRPVGLDASRQMSSLVVKRLRKKGFNYAVVNGYTQFIPFPSSYFTQVVATFPTEYISRPLSLHEINRVLTPDGELLILPAAWIVGRSPLERLAAWLFRVTRQAPESRPVSSLKDTAAGAQLKNPGQSTPVPPSEIPENIRESFLRPLEQAGFSASAEVIHIKASVALLIRASKAGPGQEV